MLRWCALCISSIISYVLLSPFFKNRHCLFLSSIIQTHRDTYTFTQSHKRKGWTKPRKDVKTGIAWKCSFEECGYEMAFFVGGCHRKREERCHKSISMDAGWISGFGLFRRIVGGKCGQKVGRWEGGQKEAININAYASGVSHSHVSCLMSHASCLMFRGEG